MKYILYVLIITLCSCNKQEIKINNKRDFYIYGIKNSHYSIFKQVFYNSKEAIIYLDKDSSQIKLFNTKGNILDRIYLNIQNELLSKINVSSIYNDIKNDTLFSLMNDTSILIITNGKSKIINFENRLVEPTLSYNTLNLNSSPFIKINDSLFLTLITRQINQSTKEGRTIFFKYPPLAFIKKRNNKWIIENLLIQYPFFVKNDSNYYNDQQLVYTSNNISVFYMMERSSFIFKYNTHNNQIDSFKIKSKYIDDKNIVPFDDSNFSSNDFYDKIIEYNYIVPKYYTLFYNKSLSLLFRVNSLKTPYIINGKRTNYRNWSVSVIDTNLNLIGEIPFLKDSLYNFYNFIPSSKGFIVAYKQTEEDKRLKRTRLCEFEISY